MALMQSCSARFLHRGGTWPKERLRGCFESCFARPLFSRNIDPALLDSSFTPPAWSCDVQLAFSPPAAWRLKLVNVSLPFLATTSSCSSNLLVLAYCCIIGTMIISKPKIGIHVLVLGAECAYYSSALSNVSKVMRKRVCLGLPAGARWCRTWYCQGCCKCNLLCLLCVIVIT